MVWDFWYIANVELWFDGECVEILANNIQFKSLARSSRSRVWVWSNQIQRNNRSSVCKANSYWLSRMMWLLIHKINIGDDNNFSEIYWIDIISMRFNHCDDKNFIRYVSC